MNNTEEQITSGKRSTNLPSDPYKPSIMKEPISRPNKTNWSWDPQKSNSKSEKPEKLKKDK